MLKSSTRNDTNMTAVSDPPNPERMSGEEGMQTPSATGPQEVQSETITINLGNPEQCGKQQEKAMTINQEKIDHTQSSLDALNRKEVARLNDALDSLNKTQEEKRQCLEDLGARHKTSVECKKRSASPLRA